MTHISGSCHTPFAPGIDQPTCYIERTRSGYRALGYADPYIWAHYVDVPFTRLRRPLENFAVSFATTGAPFQKDKGPRRPGAP